MSELIFEHYAHGKLLLSGEYFVLDGAKALAIPTKYGQHFKVYDNSESNREADAKTLIWKSFDFEDKLWFEGEFSIDELLDIQNISDEKVGKNLLQLLNSALQISGLSFDSGLEIHTNLEFPNNWGLGSSSTLIASLAEWFEIDPFELLEESFGGSGYDLACAVEDNPLFFERKATEIEVTPIELKYPFKEHIYFIHLGKKQNSREGIAHYRSLPLEDRMLLIEKISAISEAMAKAENLDSFLELIKTHENIVSESLKLPKVKDLYFSDFDGEVKSLGAWGGDFVMAVGKDTSSIRDYFLSKNYKTVLSYDEMIF